MSTHLPEPTGHVVHSGQVDHVFRWEDGHSPSGPPPATPRTPPAPPPAPPAPVAVASSRGSFNGDHLLTALAVIVGLVIAAVIAWNYISDHHWFGIGDGSVRQVLVDRGVNPDKLRVCGIQKVDDGQAWRITANSHFGCRDAFSFVLPMSEVRAIKSPGFNRSSATLGYLHDANDGGSAKHYPTGELIERYYRLVTLRLPPRVYAAMEKARRMANVHVTVTVMQNGGTAQVKVG